MDELTQAGELLRQLAHPFLARADWDGLAAALENRWSPECLQLFLDEPDERLVELATICLGLVGGMGNCEALVRILNGPRPALAETAENALWSIWFRAGGPIGRRIIRKAVSLIERHLPDRAIALLDGLVSMQPGFAEAYHQRCLAFCLMDQYEAALRDARRACRANPLHFAAWANQGNCLAQLGRRREALEAYRAALRIHPRQDVVRQSIRQLRGLLDAPHA